MSEPLIAPLLRQMDGRKVRRITIRPRHRQLYVELQKPEHKGQITSAMRALDYPVSTTKAPYMVTSTKSWRALLDEKLGEDLLATRHMELLNKRDGEYITYGRGRNRRVEFMDRGPDTTAVSRGLEMAYKLRGSFVVEPPPNPQPTTVYNLFYQPQVRAQVMAFEDQLKQAIAHEVANVPKELPTEAGPTEPEDNAGDVA